MSETALPIAVEGRELARSAHQRLNGINGSVSRLNDKFDKLDDKFDDKLGDLEGKLDSVLITLARQEGSHDANRGLLENGKFIVSMIVGVFGAILVSVLPLLIWGHP